MTSYFIANETIQLSPSVPIFFMSFGTSSVSTTRFLSVYLPGLPNIQPDVKAVIFVNGMLKLTNGFRRTVLEFRKAMLSAGSHEVNELVCSIHFWDQYLNVHGRDETMKTFWKTRRELCSDLVDPEQAGTG